MKKVMIALLMGFCILMSAQAQTIKVEANDYHHASYRIATPDFQVATVVLATDTFNQVSFKGSVGSDEIGNPDLPVLSNLIEVPVCSDVQVQVKVISSRKLSSKEALLKYRMLPTQPARSKSDFSPVRLSINPETYATDAFYSNPMAQVEVLGVARDRNLAVLKVSPLSYNPVSGELELVTEMQVSLIYQQPDITATQKLRLHANPAFEGAFNTLNSLDSKAVATSAPLHYLIVSHSSFRGSLDDFIQWKKRQGFLVTVAYTDEPGVGTTNTAIANYIKSYYDNATAALPAPTFLLLVGDHEQIPAFSARCSSPANDHITDLYFTTWTSGDHLPDCYYGRFSAQNINQLTPQINKTLLYERYDFADPSYLAKAILISGEDRGSTGDNAYVYSDPTMDYVAKYYVNADNGFTDVRYYKNNTSFAPTGVTVTGSCQTSSSAAAIRSLYSEGYGWINYSAHGNWDEWYKPSMTNSNVASMNNVGKPSVMIGNCCLTNKFEKSSCFGETLLRRGNNAGAVAYIGCTNSSYWNCDFYWSVGVRSGINNTMDATYDASRLGVYDRMFHTHAEPWSSWATSLGAVVYHGNVAAETGYSNFGLYYWEIYQIMGDPSLMPYLGEAPSMTLTYTNTLPVGTPTLDITAMPYSYVALRDTVNDVLLAAAYCGANGQCSLPVRDLTPGTYAVAAWSQGFQPAFGTVTIIAADGPYLAVAEMHSTRSVVCRDRTERFDIKVVNLGIETSPVAILTIAGASDGVASLEGPIYLNPIAAGDTLILTNVAPVYIGSNFADGDRVIISATVSWGDQSCTRNQTLSISDSRLTVSNYSLTPAIKPGMSSVFTCRVVNSGSLTTGPITFNLVNRFGILTNQPQAISLPPIESDSYRDLSFDLTFADSLPSTIIPFYLVATAHDAHQIVATFEYSYGAKLTEDFESGDFSSCDWTQTTSANPWQITTSSAHSGTHSARSYSGLSHSSSSELALIVTGTIDDTVSFYRRVSSESGYDKFFFKVDGVAYDEQSGEVAWGKVSVPVSAGMHIYSFTYEKDYSASSGSDCAWIDDVEMPFSGQLCNFVVDTVCQGSQYQFGTQELNTAETGTFAHVATINNVLTYLALTIVEQPTVSVATEGTITMGNCGVLRASGASRYEWSTGETTSAIVICPTSDNETYTVTGYLGTCSVEASFSPSVGIAPIAVEPQVGLYPNPTTGVLSVSAEAIQYIEVLDLMGNRVLGMNGCSDVVRVDLRQLPKGVYFVKVKTETSSVIRKVVKQ